MPNRIAWLLTWNPHKWQWVDYADCLAETTAGRTVIRNWTCINRNVQLGDCVYLEVLGNNVTRGIIASGKVIREPYCEMTWRGKLGYKIDVEFDTILPIEDALPQAKLKDLFPETCWSTQVSGIEIKPSQTRGSLEQLWAEHVLRTISGDNKDNNPDKDRLSHLQKRIRAFNQARDWDKFHSPANLAKSIAIEAGELLECFQWKEDDYDLNAVKGELADVVNYCLQMAMTLNLDVVDIVNEKMDVTERKYPVEKSKGISTKYDRL